MFSSSLRLIGIQTTLYSISQQYLNNYASIAIQMDLLIKEASRLIQCKIFPYTLVWSTACPLLWHLIFSSSQRWIGLHTIVKKYLNNKRTSMESIVFQNKIMFAYTFVKLLIYTVQGVFEPLWRNICITHWTVIKKKVLIHSLSSCMTSYLLLISTFNWFSNKFWGIYQQYMNK